MRRGKPDGGIILTPMCLRTCAKAIRAESEMTEGFVIVCFSCLALS